ncbi:MAG: hypothetical protein EOO60_05575 [Hymenobacter sp.]|nr:MAG: hypothetical protein EOO60_05575 [Hymenobacter sp.]
MSDFKSKTRKLTSKTYPAQDTGISVADALVLIADSEYREPIMLALDINSIAGDTIQIPGARSLVDSVMEIDSKFEKFDLHRHYQDLVFVRPDADSEYHENDVALALNAELPHTTAIIILSFQSSCF